MTRPSLAASIFFWAACAIAGCDGAAPVNLDAGPGMDACACDASAQDSGVDARFEDASAGSSFDRGIDAHGDHRSVVRSGGLQPDR